MAFNRFASAVLFTAWLAATTYVAASVSAFQAPASAPAGDTSSGDLDPERQGAADLLAEATIETVCNVCHSFEDVVSLRRTRADWSAVVARMRLAGAVGTEEQFRMVRRYLTRYYGTIRVNSATADEFSAVLGYSQKDAAAIVTHRQARGPFANLAALASVPGLDRSKIDEQPEALRFD
jgi:cytochrome c5